MIDLFCSKTHDRSEYIALWIPSLLSFSRVSWGNNTSVRFSKNPHIRYRVVYLLQLVSDYVFVRQTKDEREGVIDGHGDISAQLP